VLLAAVLIPPLLARIRAEENLLRAQFGSEYDALCPHFAADSRILLRPAGRRKSRFWAIDGRVGSGVGAGRWPERLPAVSETLRRGEPAGRGLDAQERKAGGWRTSEEVTFSGLGPMVTRLRGREHAANDARASGMVCQWLE
jgi:hypothetical protein